MTAICFHWEPPTALQGNPAASKKLMLHWTHTGKCFGVTEFYCLPIAEAAGHVPAVGVDIDFHVIGSLTELPQDRTLVFVEQGGNPLRGFTHPDDCIYVFGSDYNSLGKSDLSLDADFPLYAEQACAIVLHDRRMKRGGHQ